MVCNIRGKKNNDPGKAKFIKETGEIQIYEKCINVNSNHKGLDFEQFKKLYYSDNYKNVDMNIKLYQKFFVQCLLMYSKCNSYTECIYNFGNKFKNISFNLIENIVNKLKLKIYGGIKNSTIEEIAIQ